MTQELLRSTAGRGSASQREEFPSLEEAPDRLLAVRAQAGPKEQWVLLGRVWSKTLGFKMKSTLAHADELAVRTFSINCALSLTDAPTNA